MKKLILIMLFGASIAFSGHSPTYTADYIQQHTEVTGRNFYDYLSRLGISEHEVLQSNHKKWLSVGEGNSNFTAEAAKRGIDATSLDALVKNPHSPERSVIGLAQKLPFKDQEFDRVVAVWLLDCFFDSKRFNDSDTGILALKEMIRVTKVGGDIAISPIKEYALNKIVEVLKKDPSVRYELLPYFKGAFRNSENKRIFEVSPVQNEPNGSIRITKLAIKP